MNIPGSLVNSAGPARFAWYLLPLGVYVFAILWFLSDSPYSRSDFPIDDAWIHQVYSRSFAHGEGFAYNAGQQEAGSTSPLWVMATAPAHWLNAVVGGNIAWYVKLTGFILGVVCLLLVFDFTLFLTDSLPAASFASTLLALESSFLFSALSGMETILVVTLWIAGIAALARKRPLLASFLFGLLPTARPEALVVVAFCLALILFELYNGKSQRAILRIILLLIPSLLWVVFCLAVNGHPLPNTYYIKSQDPILTSYRFRFLWQVFTDSGFSSAAVHIYGLLSLVLISLLGRAREQSATWILLLFITPVAYALGVVATREMLTSTNYYWTRWVDPAFLILSAAEFAGLAGSLGKQLYLSARTSRALLALSIVLILAYSPAMFESLVRSKTTLSSGSRTVHFTFVSAGKGIDQFVPVGDTVAVMDAGATRFFGNRTTIDLVGLNSAEICMRKISRTDKLFQTKWLLLPPLYFSEQGLLGKILERYDPLARFSVPSAGENAPDGHTEATGFVLYRRNSQRESDGLELHGE